MSAAKPTVTTDDSTAAVDVGPIDEQTATALLQLTREMVTAAHAQDWGTVTSHDHRRRRLLADAPSAADPLPIALREALLAADLAVREQARRGRDAATEGAHQVRAERDARDSYARVMSGR